MNILGKIPYEYLYLNWGAEMLNKNKEFETEYKKQMACIKKINREEFWRKSIRKRLVRKIINFKALSIITEKIVPYEFCDIDVNCNYFSSDRIAIYTAIFGKYDDIIEPETIADNCDFYIITDQNVPEKSKWKKIDINLTSYDVDISNNIEKNRFIKMHPNIIFPKYKYSIYIDGNIKILTDPTEFIHKNNKYGVKLHKHYRRNCVYDEIEECIKLGKDCEGKLNNYKERLKSEGMPNNYGLLEAPIIVRNHHNSFCKKIMNEWWKEFKFYCERDQISLPYILWKNNIKIEEISLLGNDIYSNYAFKKEKHK